MAVQICPQIYRLFPTRFSEVSGYNLWRDQAILRARRRWLAEGVVSRLGGLWRGYTEYDTARAQGGEKGDMDPGEQTTDTRDEHYDLISVLYHNLKGADICDLYALDAEAGGRADLYEFFREAQAAQAQLAERAKELLGIGVGAAPGTAGGVPSGAAPPKTDVVEPQGPPEAGLPPEAPPESDLPVE